MLLSSQGEGAPRIENMGANHFDPYRFLHAIVLEYNSTIFPKKCTFNIAWYLYYFILSFLLIFIKGANYFGGDCI